jgi:hypothetical protein
MDTRLDRRTFLRLASATAALMAQEARPETTSQAISQTKPQAGVQAGAQAAGQQSAPAAPAARRGRVAAVQNRKNYVGIQVRAFAWIDEGIDEVLDNIQKKGGVNTVWAYTFTYGETRLRKGGGLPDHGVSAAEAGVAAGAFYDYDQKYFQNTILKDFRSTGYGTFNVIEQVAPKAKARGMDFFAWDMNNANAGVPRLIANYAEVTEVDLNGRRTSSPCFNHPDYRAFLSGKVESLLAGYASAVDGVAWGCEREGPLNGMLSGGGAGSCFCQFCQAKGRERGISVERAREGYRQLGQLFHGAGQNARPADGYFVSFWRLLLQYPEILSWETLWTESFQEMQAELYGMGKELAPEKPFGFHMMQSTTFSPFCRAEEDYTKRRGTADFLKLATYNNAGGPRMEAFLNGLGRGIFRDATPQDFLALYYKMMNYAEAPYDQLASAGLSPDYVAKETRRALAAVGGEVKIYPGIDIDVPTLSENPKPTDKRTKPEDVSRRGAVARVRGDVAGQPDGGGRYAARDLCAAGQTCVARGVRAWGGGR